MSLRLALILAVLFGVLVAYLASLNTVPVRLALGREWQLEAPLIALLVGAFLLGAVLALLGGLLRDLTRTWQDYQLARQARRAESVRDLYHRGVDAQLAGKTEEAAQAYGEVLKREPGNTEAPVRLGELAEHRGDTQGALTWHLQALRSDERPETLLTVAEDYRRLGRPDDAIAMYQRVLARDRDHVTALRGLRELAAERERWADALAAQERIVALAARDDRPAEEAWLAGIHYELGRAALAAGDTAGAIARFREALRVVSDFLPAALVLGDAHLKAGDAREAMRTWERALESQPSLPLLGRLEQQYRADGKPTRMISLYQAAAARQPDTLALAFGLGRVYFELAMLDEAAEQFEKMEVRAPELPVVHAYLGAIFERRGQAREACEEYRRALRFTGSFEWPHRCSACGAGHPRWLDRCPSCRRWNTSRP
ncbi:MAG TPA: lipopolysaccharide assembly protein LapA domain-containing protein [Methylomirabilota bacterium]|nr:lipopolysaccharide assembly protein LapA domain-containing protein [Methylomirabilota bacterium]